MKDIRFRAWDTKDQKMIHYQPLTYGIEYMELHAQLEGNNEHWIDDSFARDNRLIFMQFTGLYDKNEKEIYEGDILQVAEMRDNTTYFYADNKPLYEPVIYSLDGFRLFGERLSDLNKYFVVIGDRYTNPELLENIL